MTSDLDVEALLDSVANSGPGAHDEKQNTDRRRDDRNRDAKQREPRGTNGERDVDMKSPRSDERGSVHGSYSPRRRSRSRDRRDRGRYQNDRRDRRGSGGGGDYYRGSGRARSRSRSPDPDRYYRPARRERDNRETGRERDKDRGQARGRDGGRRDGRRSASAGDDDRDSRTVFVQQLANRLRVDQLTKFFEKAGPVKDAQIVKDRVSGRSKGVGYVEFKSKDSVDPAIQLTGQQLLGIPIIVQHTEAEKNRIVKKAEGNTPGNGAPFHRLYVGNIHFSITEDDIRNIFEPFGDLEFVQLQREEAGRSRGYGFVQYVQPEAAKEALEQMNGFEIAGRPIRVGLGNDKFTPESTANLLQQFGQGNGANFQGSSFSGRGGRGAHAGGSGGSFDRAGGRDNDKTSAGAGALDDSDVAGVNFNNFSRNALMRKLARTDEPVTANSTNAKLANAKPRTETKPLPVNVSQASRCIKLTNCFSPEEETGANWVQELEEDVRAECEKSYGHVVHISVEPNPAGEIYVKFDTIAGGEKAILGLNGRFFNGRQVTAQPIVDAVYSSLFSRSRAT